jgi:hypothetical protein
VRRAGPRAAPGSTSLPDHAAILRGKVALAWAAMDAFYEEDDRILGHAADPYHRIDIRHSSRHLVVRSGDRVVADTTSPLVLYESGFAPRWYVPRDDVVADELTLEDLQAFCPTRASPPTTTSTASATPPGPTAHRSTTWRRSATSSPSSPTASRSRWTASASSSSPADRRLARRRPQSQHRRGRRAHGRRGRVLTTATKQAVMLGAACADRTRAKKDRWSLDKRPVV